MDSWIRPRHGLLHGPEPPGLRLHGGAFPRAPERADAGADDPTPDAGPDAKADDSTPDSVPDARADDSSPDS